jgi:hypothetical protein
MPPSSDDTFQTRTYPPRTAALVALGSLAASFMLVFGGGLLIFRSNSGANRTAPVPAVAVSTGRSFALSAEPDAAAPLSTATAGLDPGGPDPLDPSAGTAPNAQVNPTAANNSANPSASATVQLGAVAISRCFDAGPPTPIPGANCGALPALQQYLVSKSAAIAACGRGAHGHLALVLDFRFSTSFARGWGSPASNIARAGDVAGCVKQAILPLPYATMAHDHDRYYTLIPIDF